jgi:hypothetical protein
MLKPSNYQLEQSILGEEELPVRGWSGRGTLVRIRLSGIQLLALKHEVDLAVDS